MTTPSTTDEKTDSGGQVRPFADFLQELDKGKVATELGTSLQELVAEVTRTGKKGSLVLTVEVQPVSGNDEQVTVGAKVASKLPARTRASSFFFVTGERNLTRSDPRQMRLPLSAVPDDGTADAAAGGQQ